MAMAMAILTDSSSISSCFHACSLPSLSSSHTLFPTRNGFVSVVRRGSHQLKRRTVVYGENLVSNSSCYWNGSAKGGEEAILEKGMRRQRKREFDTVDASDNVAVHRKAKGKKVVRTTEPCCYGCGAPLQTSDANSPGYVPLDRFLLKKKHHQLKALLCARCCLLAQGKMIPAVGGNGGYGGKRFILAEQLREQLSHLRDEKALIIKLVDIVDFNGSFLTHIRDLVGANPIILVATKADLLPKGTDLKAVGDWLIECTLRKKLSVLSVHLTSSKSLMGISGVVSDMQQCRQGRNVYILGSANVGKSAFVGALLEAMSQRDPIALAAQRLKPIQSAMPGTTLGPIKLDVFSGGGSLFDTPGIHLHHRMAAVVPPEDLFLLGPRRRLRGILASLPGPQQIPKLTSASAVLEMKGSSLWAMLDGSWPVHELQVKSKSQCNGSDAQDSVETLKNNSTGISVFWGGIVRLDVVKVPWLLRLRFYGPDTIPIICVPSIEADLFYKGKLGTVLTPPSGEDRSGSWSGLQSQHTIRFTVKDERRPSCDIAISGLGWVTVESATMENRVNRDSSESREKVDHEALVIVHVPRAVEVFLREPIPVGIQGTEWYEYSELEEEDLEKRPILFCP